MGRSRYSLQQSEYYIQGRLDPIAGERAICGVIYISNEKIGSGFRLEQDGHRVFLMVNNFGDKVDFQPGSVSKEQAKDEKCDFEV